MITIFYKDSFFCFIEVKREGDIHGWMGWLYFPFCVFTLGLDSSKAALNFSKKWAIAEFTSSASNTRDQSIIFNLSFKQSRFFLLIIRCDISGAFFVWSWYFTSEINKKRSEKSVKTTCEDVAGVVKNMLSMRVALVSETRVGIVHEEISDFNVIGEINSVVWVFSS